MPRLTHLPVDADLKLTDKVLIDDPSGTKVATLNQMKPLFVEPSQQAADTHISFSYEGVRYTSPLHIRDFDLYLFNPKNSTTAADNIYAISSNEVQLGGNVSAVILVKNAVSEDGFFVIENNKGDKHFSKITNIDQTDKVITLEDSFSDYTEYGINELGSTAEFFIGDLYYGDTNVLNQAISFGNSSGEVATWAEGDNTDRIPSNKIPNIQFGDQHVYTTISARNAATDVEWHQGDRALIGNDTDGYEFYVYIGDNQDSAGVTTDADWVHLNMTLSFGSGDGNIATWAEGSNTGLIPASKIQAYTTVQDSTGNSVNQEDAIRFSNNFEVSSEDGYTLIEHSNVLDIGEPTGINPGEVNIQGFASTNLPHINLIGAGVSSQDVGQVVFQHYHQIEDEVNTLFKIIGGAENHQIDPDDSSGYDEDGYLKFIAVESKDGASDIQVEVASFHKDKIVLNEELHITDLSGTGTYLIVDADGVVSRGSVNSAQFADQQALEDFISNKADFRSDIGAGTSNLVLGNTSTTALAGNTTTITQSQADAIVANTAKVGITIAQADAIVANSAKVGITTAQANAIIANTAKVGITTAQADAITANTAKISYPTADSTKLAGIESGADVTDTANVESALGISASGSATMYLNEQGNFVAVADNSYTLPDDLNAFRSIIADDGELASGATFQPSSDNNGYLGSTSRRFQTIYSQTNDSERYVVQSGGRIYGGTVNNNNTNIRFETDSDISMNFSGNTRFRIGNDSLNFSTNVLGTGAQSDNLLTVNSSGDVRELSAIEKVINQQNSSNTIKFWHGTQAQYDALTPDTNTIYFTT